MSFFSVDLQCVECGHTWDTLVPRDEKDNLHICKECGKIAAKRLMGAPALMQRALPDGTKRFQKLRNQDAVERAMSGARTTKERVALSHERDKISQKKS